MHSLSPIGKTISVLTSASVKDAANGTNWAGRFKEIDTSKITDERLISTVREHKAFRFIVEDD